ncbi:hypothetical protein IW262DRAFT_1280913 [Armillaria fumosa]|nr:hypothetical protein IW262DRAFT_1280913 [Armillaria fumosa]
MKKWADGLFEIHPHTKAQNSKPNVHASFHLYDFLLLFGPVYSWWTFPFERLIGTLQKINTNDHVGGALEATVLQSFMKGANLRRWLNRPDCPDIIVEFKTLFDRAFSTDTSPRNLNAEPPMSQQSYHAHYFFDRYNFSRECTHVGNSLVIYYPTVKSTAAVAGSIQKITTEGDQVHFHIKRQAPLPPSKYDPFHRYPSFPARVYSSKMSDDPLDKISPSLVVSHAARFEFSHERAVILNLSKVCFTPLFLSFC